MYFDNGDRWYYYNGELSNYSFIMAKISSAKNELYDICRHCVLSGKQSRERTGACTMFGIQVQILIGAAAAMAVLLVALIIMVCRKNQKSVGI